MKNPIFLSQTSKSFVENQSIIEMIKKNEIRSEYQVAEKKLKHPFSSHTFPYNWF